MATDELTGPVPVRDIVITPDTPLTEVPDSWLVVLESRGNRDAEAELARRARLNLL